MYPSCYTIEVIMAKIRKSNAARKRNQIKPKASMSARQQYRLKSKQIKSNTKLGRTTEAEKTRRSMARSAMVTSSISNAMASEASARKKEAEERTKQANAASQMAQLINGNIGSSSPVNDDTKGSSDRSGPWSSINITG